jgi:hypothetical protein
VSFKNNDSKLLRKETRKFSSQRLETFKMPNQDIIHQFKTQLLQSVEVNSFLIETIILQMTVFLFEYCEIG